MSNDDLLCNTLQELTVASRQLLEVLERETAVVVKRDVQTLVDVLREKQDRVARVESLEQQRQKRCAELGFAPDTLPQSYTTLWDQVLELARQCQQINRDNHALLVTNQRYVDEALRILTANGEDPSPAYTASGVDKKPGGRSFGQA